MLKVIFFISVLFLISAETLSWKEHFVIKTLKSSFGRIVRLDDEREI
jgi:hypothetical protein